MKRILTVLIVTAGFGLVLPGTLLASQTIIGRITDYNATSLSVRAGEIVTVTIDERTTYSKWITQKPWQQDSTLTFSALGVGRLVAVHKDSANGNVASWVQIATDMPVVAGVASRLSPQSGGSGSTSPKPKSSDLLTSKQVRGLIATATTSADHVKLQKHFLALAAKYEADAKEHAADAEAYRKNPSFRDSKNPAGPGTAAHCDRFAELDLQAAKKARDLASAHEHMAGAK